MVLQFNVVDAHTVVTDTRLELHQGDFVPRFVRLPGTHYVVPAGVTIELPAYSQFDAIEVSGTLRVSREHDTVCRFINLQVLPGGVLDMGTTEDPVLRHVEFIIRDAPLDTVNDPYQWGNGIFNVGTWTACGRRLSRTWTVMESAQAGATTLTFDVPAEWQVGDELLIPDTRQLAIWPWKPYAEEFILIRRESPVRVAAISANAVALTKPLDFEHLAAVSPPQLPVGDYNLDGRVDSDDYQFWRAHYGATSGEGLQADGDKNGEVDTSDYVVWKRNEGRTSEQFVRFKPYVANASRNIVIRSENPQGVRGHTVTTDIGLQQLAWVAFVGLGRTSADALNNTTIVNSVFVPGTNQVGKYPVHLHHVHSANPWSFVRGLYIDGTDRAKWGMSIHGTSDTQVEQCVVYGCVGAGLVTEDGPEVRNSFIENFVMGCTGDPFSPGAKIGLDLGKSGSEGAGIWMHGALNTLDGNVCCNNSIGMSFMGFVVSQYSYPSVPGGPLDTSYDRFASRGPISCSNNVTFSNLTNGFDSWFYVPDTNYLQSWHNGFAQVSCEENSGVYLRNAQILGDDWLTVAVHSNPGYVGFAEITDSRLEGCAEGVNSVIQAIGHYTILRSTLYNKTNFNWVSQDGPPADGFPVDVDCLAVPGVSGEPNVKIDWDVEGNGPFNLYGNGYPGDEVSTNPAVQPPPGDHQPVTRPPGRPGYRPPSATK